MVVRVVNRLASRQQSDNAVVRLTLSDLGDCLVVSLFMDIIGEDIAAMASSTSQANALLMLLTLLKQELYAAVKRDISCTP